ncbi:MAG: dihydropteroate synthase, partial [Peptostreptococcaceae bacterium]|nr:dihydropteroate synthase [Peptostreptococcaceae bacterium]
MFDYNKRTYIMGILNVTPDSFSDGGKFNSIDQALKHALEMVEEGADIIDLGGESTRPGHIYVDVDYVDVDEELKRVIPVVKKLKEELDTPISVDTYKAKVADESLKLGVEMINDVWGLTKDKDMASVIAKHNAYVCIMHNQDDTEYDKDIMESIKEFLLESINIAI